MMRTSLIQLTLIHFREFIREPGIIFWSIIFPVLMALVLGIAFSNKNETIQTVALIRDTAYPNAGLQIFLQDAKVIKQDTGGIIYQKVMVNDKLGKTTYKLVLSDWNHAIRMLKRGETNMIVREVHDSLDYYFDPQSQEAKLGYIMLSSAVRQEKAIYNNGTIRPLTSAGMRYIDFLVPGLLAMGIMNSLIWGISYGLIEMRVKKLLRRMVATPMKKSEFLISYFIARFSLSFVESMILFSFTWFFFKVTIQGSLLALLLLFIAGNIVFAGISILLSARVENTRVGTGLMNFILLPMTVLSGIFFSYHNFPDWAVSFIRILPLTMLADGFRSVFIEGAGLWQSLPAVMVLSGLGVFCFLIGLKIYKWY